MAIYIILCVEPRLNQDIVDINLRVKAHNDDAVMIQRLGLCMYNNSVILRVLNTIVRTYTKQISISRVKE